MNIEQEILQIKGRNKKVESDKAWERSWTRRLSITIFTYIVAEVWLLIIREPHSWLKAFVPVVGYILSTLTLPPIKKVWVNKRIDQN
jgi:hypothetical protein